MTSPVEPQRLVGPFGRALLFGGTTLVLASAIGLSGCGDEPAPPPPPPPPVVTAPSWDLSDIDMDERVQFPDRYTPSSESLAQAVADIASGLIGGDAALMRRHLSQTDTRLLRVLASSGQWDRATDELQAVRIVRLDEDGDNATVGIAYQTPQGAVLMAWRGFSDGGERWGFSSMAIEPRMAMRVGDLDDAELTPPSFELAKRIDELVEIVRQQEDGTRGTDSDDGFSQPTSPGGGTSPSRGPFAPG